MPIPRGKPPKGDYVGSLDSQSTEPDKSSGIDTRRAVEVRQKASSADVGEGAWMQSVREKNKSDQARVKKMYGYPK